MLPAKPASARDDTRGALAELVEADAGAGRLLACTLYARSGAPSDAVYVHAKVGIVDDRWLTIGSANLNEHSLFNDTEMNIVTDDEELARSTRCGCGRSTSSCRAEELGRRPGGGRGRRLAAGGGGAAAPAASRARR